MRIDDNPVRRVCSLSVAMTVVVACGGIAQASPTPEGIAFFESKIRPVLAEHCYQCHSADALQSGKLKANLLVDSREGMAKGGESGAAVVPGKREDSLLLAALRYDGFEMPPTGKLPDAVIADFETWIDMGAPDPREEPAATVDERTIDVEAGRQHWSYRRLASVPAPDVNNTAWVANDIDRFILAKQEAAGIGPNPAVTKETLARRVHFDLTGLPPTPEELQAFLADESPDAYDRLVDRLLASQRFGERWARHWLDVARYSDTKGYVFLEERRYPYAYTYRDWVVNAFNQDLPYDQFLRLQIAADQISKDPENNRDLAALGFLTLGRRFLNSTPDIIDDRIDVVMRGTQGLTMACARCHDHKFDPLPTTEYYSLYAIFNSSQEPKELPPLKPFTRTKETDEFDTELAVRQKKLNDFIQSRYELSYSPEKTAA
jgi:hypothetical protein